MSAAAHLAEPFGIEAHFGALSIQHLEHLCRRRSWHWLDIFFRERLARDVLTGRIADHAGEVADQENDLMPEFLELAHLVEQHGVAEMQVGRSRVEAGLDAQAAARPLSGTRPGAPPSLPS
jgi:hypothetical protein